MTIVSYLNALKDFKGLIDKVNTDLDAVTITTNDYNAILISENNYNAIMETLYLQQSPANVEHLAKSVKDLERGNTIEVDIG